VGMDGLLLCGTGPRESVSETSDKAQAHLIGQLHRWRRRQRSAQRDAARPEAHRRPKEPIQPRRPARHAPTVLRVDLDLAPRAAKPPGETRATRSRKPRTCKDLKESRSVLRQHRDEHSVHVRPRAWS
jgi:hypothetical protein